jgi:hypothetical protein
MGRLFTAFMAGLVVDGQALDDVGSFANLF